MYTTRLLVQPTTMTHPTRSSPHLQATAHNGNHHLHNSPLKLRKSVSREGLKELKKQERQLDHAQVPPALPQWLLTAVQHIAWVYHWSHYVHGMMAMTFGFLLLLSSVGIAAIVGQSHWFTNRPNVPLYIYLSFAVVYLGCELIYVSYMTFGRHSMPNRRQRRTLLHHSICMTALITSLAYCMDTWLILIGLLLGELPQPFAALDELKEGLKKGRILSPTANIVSGATNKDASASGRRPRSFSFGESTVAQRGGMALTLPTLVSEWLAELSHLPARELQLCTLVFTRFCMLQYCTHVIIPYAQLSTTRYCSLSLMLLSFWSILDLALHMSERGRLLFINWPF